MMFANKQTKKRALLPLRRIHSIEHPQR